MKVTQQYTTIRLMSGTELEVSREDGYKIKESIESGDEHIFVGSDLVKVSTITEVMDGTRVVDRYNDNIEFKYLPNGKMKCRGEKSLHLAAMRAVRQQYPKEFTTRFRDISYMDSVKDTLRDANPSKNWCDFRREECSCDGSHKAPGIEAVIAMFPGSKILQVKSVA